MALKDKLMTLEDFKAVRDVDVASNSAQFTEIKAKLGLPESVKSALLLCFEHVSWEDGAGRDYFNILKNAVEPTPERWDYEWDYTMGKLEEQTGWKKEISGTASSMIISDGEKITTADNSYFQIFPDRDGSLASLRNMPDGHGVIEVECYGVWSNNSNNLRIHAVEDQTNRCGIIASNGKWRLLRNSATASDDNVAIADAPANTMQKIRIVLRHNKADIYIDGNIVATNVEAISTAGNINNIMHQSGGDGRYAVIRSLKIRLGLE